MAILRRAHDLERGLPWSRSRSGGWVRRSTGPAAATTRSTASRSTRRPSRACSTGPVEFVLHPENGLPQGSAKNATDGFRYLVDEGCIGVAGAYSSDNAITVGPLANELQVPLISWCGTERLQGDYCFRLGNGDCGGDAALVVGWLKRNGHERVAVLSEISPNGEEYFRFFRQECRRRGVSIAAVETVSQSPENLATNLDNLRQVERRRPRLHGLRDARREGPAARGARQARLGPAAHHGHVVHVLSDGLRQVRGLGRRRPARSEQPAGRGIPRAVRRALRRGPAVLAERDPGARVRHRARARRGPLPRADPVRPGPEGGARDDPLHAEHHGRRRRPTSRARRTSTGCSAATGCSTAGSRTASSSSKVSSSPGSE